jgi:hypothetical protein
MPINSKYPVLKLPQRPKIQIQRHHCRRQPFAPNTNRVSVGNQKLSFLEIASKDHIFPKVPISAKLRHVVAFFASTSAKKALDI